MEHKKKNQNVFLIRCTLMAPPAGLYKGVLTFRVVAIGSSQQPLSVLGVGDVQLDQVFLLQVLQVVHRLVAVEQQSGGVLLQNQAK